MPTLNAKEDWKIDFFFIAGHIVTLKKKMSSFRRGEKRSSREVAVFASLF